MSGHRVVRVGQLRACAPNSPSRSPHHFQPKALQGLRRGGVLVLRTPPWWNSNVKVSLFASCLLGGAGELG
ncbi:hypothetical protein OIU74_015306 [Salix koriyanagi]|uniref:Uncharacterized protein n=1 Tax=Salix koriyanagi TaxID=2511006 RepID=A0A9Q0T0R7_9ROSI|nr:hypothetical protein OIU74_015306 [Salix koriyanagi]